MLSTLRHGSSRSDATRPPFDWEKLPAPAFDHLLSLLRTEKSCDDLASLRQTSRIHKQRVDQFMNRPGNRAQFGLVLLEYDEEQLSIELHMYPANLPFHDLRPIEWTRWKREIDGNGEKTYSLAAKVRGPRDPAIGQARALLLLQPRRQGLAISGVRSYRLDWNIAKALCEGLNAEYFAFVDLPLIDNFMSTRIIEHLERGTTKEIYVESTGVELNDPASFIARIDSFRFEKVILRQKVPYNGTVLGYDTFFGLPIAYWETLLTEKIRSGSKCYYNAVELTDAPVSLQYKVVHRIKWERA